MRALSPSSRGRSSSNGTPARDSGRVYLLDVPPAEQGSHLRRLAHRVDEDCRHAIRRQVRRDHLAAAPETASSSSRMSGTIDRYRASTTIAVDP